MPTECSPTTMLFAPVEGRRVAADFAGGAITSDAGALLLGATDRAIGLVDRFAACFADGRARERVEHEVSTLVGQRVFGLALGYEDVSDHDHLRHDPVMAVLAGKLAARRSDCAPLAGKSTLNRLELSRPAPTRYHKIAHDPAAIERLFVDLFLEAQQTAPKQIVLDLDATDDPIHGHQEGRFFHGYGACPRAGKPDPGDCYCYLPPSRPGVPSTGGPGPLYIFCGRHLLAARLRRSDIDASAGSVEEVARIIAQVRSRWPRVRVLLRADSGFAREALMAWCGANRVDYLFGLARNARLEAEIAAELTQAAAESRATGRSARRFRDFMWTTLDSWSRRRRVIGKAECTKGDPNPRFIVTSLKPKAAEARYLYERVYCARGEMENRIKECQLDLFADRTSAATMRANQLRLWFASMAYVPICALPHGSSPWAEGPRIGLAHTQFAAATCGTIRLALLKIGALVRISVRRIHLAMASGCPWQNEFQLAHLRLTGDAR
jgi:Transposase DDE domain group 1